MRIGFFGVKKWEKEYIEREIIELPTFGVGIFEEDLIEVIDKATDFDIVSVCSSHQINPALLDKLPKVKMLVLRSHGLPNETVAMAKAHGVVVKDIEQHAARAVAEYSMALLLAVTKKITVAKEAAEEGDMMLGSLTGVSLYGKTLGVIGVGSIGQTVVSIARGFGMKVLGVERSIDQPKAKKVGFKAVDLETCLMGSDFVTVHVPSTTQTYHLINKKTISLMRKGSILINTSRGPILDTQSVLWGLEKRILAGVGLDSVEEEDRIDKVGVWPESVSFRNLIDRDDVIFTPHNSFNVKEVWKENVKATVININEFMGK